LGNVVGTRTNGTVRIRPPDRRVDNPRGTGLARTVVSPRARRYAYNPEIDDNRASDRARRQTGLAVRHPHHCPVAALMGQELEHVRRPHGHRVLRHDREEHLQIERHRPQRVRPAPARDELEIAVDERIAERVTGLTRG
jgi:hypothetical protein